ncbi:MAG: energy transducer TonB [Bryobacteraceae bacterium]
MAAHGDILDQTDPLGRWFAGSLVLHLSLFAAVAGYGLVKSSSKENWGDVNGGGMGAVAVNVVSSIKLPRTTGPTNPVANDTESHVPEPKPTPKTLPKVKAPEPDANAIPLKSRNALKKAPKKVARDYSPPNKFREQQKDLPNQLYSHEGQQVNTDLYNKAGAGGVGIGTDSPFGNRFGPYATMLRNKVAQNWRANDVNPRIQSAPEVVVEFLVNRDGSVPQNSVRVVQTSGIRELDVSAQRAILDASPFGPLPAQFEKSQADIELHFQLRR